MADRRYNQRTTQQRRTNQSYSYQRTRRARLMRRRRQRRRRMIFGAAIVLLLLIIILICTGNGGKKKQDNAVTNVMETAIASQTALPIASEDPAATVEPEASVESAASAEPAPSAQPVADPASEVAYPAYAALRPQAKTGWLPVFRSIDTEDKVIAITVDDCFQASNLRAIIDLAIENNGKLTFFPIGQQALREPQQAALKYAWENGMELENHTFTHNGLYNCSDEELAGEIYKQNLVLSKLLGVEYQCHFLRPKGGDARNDQRIHAYISQLGYFGVAHWSKSGNRDIEQLKANLTPGQIYLFHTTDKDLERLRSFIPYVVSQGYRLLTLNEMFGYPANAYTELEKPIEEHEIPALQPYERVLVTYKIDSYAYGVKLVQDRLVELNYLKKEGDGIYGKKTAKAVGMFQKAAGLEVTGEADADTQTRLFASDAVSNTGKAI